MTEALLLLAGAVVGVLADRSWERVVRLVGRRSAGRRRAAHTARASFVPQISFLNLPAGVRQLRTASGTPIPVLTPTAVSEARALRPDESYPLRLATPFVKQLEASPRELEHFQKVTGRRLFPGTCCYLLGPLAQLGVGTAAVEVVAESFDHYIATYAGALERRGGPGPGDVNRWRAWVDDFTGRLGRGEVALQVGCTVALVERVDGVWSSVQHTRSQEVSITPGLVTNIPVFGVEPSTRFGHTSRLGLLQYNLLREMGEELYSIPELESAVVTKRFDADWILSCLPVKNFFDRWEAGTVEVRCYGAVVNLVTANVQLLVAAVDGDRGFTEALALASANWEVDPGTDGPALRLRPVGELSRLWDGGETRISPSAVALDTLLARSLATPG